METAELPHGVLTPEAKAAMTAEEIITYYEMIIPTLEEQVEKAKTDPLTGLKKGHLLDGPLAAEILNTLRSAAGKRILQHGVPPELLPAQELGPGSFHLVRADLGWLSWWNHFGSKTGDRAIKRWSDVWTGVVESETRMFDPRSWERDPECKLFRSNARGDEFDMLCIGPFAYMQWIMRQSVRYYKQQDLAVESPIPPSVHWGKCSIFEALWCERQISLNNRDLDTTDVEVRITRVKRILKYVADRRMIVLKALNRALILMRERKHRPEVFAQIEAHAIKAVAPYLDREELIQTAMNMPEDRWYPLMLARVTAVEKRRLNELRVAVQEVKVYAQDMSGSDPQSGLDPRVELETRSLSIRTGHYPTSLINTQG